MMKRLAISIAFAALAFVGATDVKAEVAASASLQVKATVPTPGSMFLTARPPRPILSPTRVTLGLRSGGVFRSRIVGMRPGGIVYAGVRARPVILYVGAPTVVVGAPSPVVVVDRPSPVVVVEHARPVVVVEHPRPIVEVHVGGPSVHVGGRFKGKGKFRGRH
jgi:hypothetical protein